MSTKTKFAIGIGVGVAVAVGAMLINVRSGQGGMSGMDDMSGMEGMPGMEGEGSVGLSAGDVLTFGVTFGAAEMRLLERTVRAVGLVEFDETRMAFVSPKFGGWAERLHVDFTGQPVRAGQPLIDVYAPELVTAQEELLLAARMLESVRVSSVDEVTAGAADLYASARGRLEYWDISSDQIDRLLETGEVRRTLTVYAPVSGIVMEKHVFQGQSFEAGANLYMIADLSSVWVSAEVFEMDQALVVEGMPADVTFDALPGRSFSGRIGYVYPTLRDRTRSMQARISLDNPGGQLKPGMYASVRLTASLGQVLTLPASAVLLTGERALTFVDLGSGSFMPQEVRVGVRGGDLVQVLSGVEPGQRVVTSAQYLLDSESNLAEVMRAMMAQMNLADMGSMDMSGGATTGPDTTGRR